VCVAVLIPQSLQLRTQVTLTSLGWCHKSGECWKRACRSVCFCNQSGGGDSSSCNHV